MSTALLEYFDREVNRTLRQCYEDAYTILAGIGRPASEEIADRLVAERTWTGKQFDAVCTEVLRPALVG